jgi:AcrR family transcriptional regulator
MTSDVGPALCAAAVALLLTDGVAAIDPDLVDREAGLAPGTCRGHYHSRSELIAAVLEREAATYWAALDAVEAEHPGDPAGALVAWMTFLVGPGRTRTRALWALGLDPGTRRDAQMYLDALTAGWERGMTSRFGLTHRQILVVWPMIEGWAIHRILFDAPTPDLDLLRDFVRRMLERSA